MTPIDIPFNSFLDFRVRKFFQRVCKWKFSQTFSSFLILNAASYDLDIKCRTKTSKSATPRSSSATSIPEYEKWQCHFSESIFIAETVITWHWWKRTIDNNAEQTNKRKEKPQNSITQWPSSTECVYVIFTTTTKIK